MIRFNSIERIYRKRLVITLTYVGVITLFIGSNISCTVDPKVEISDEVLKNQLLQVPAGFPEIPFDSDNEFSLPRWRLGKRLFYDKSLSKDNSTSCASCHQSGFAFSDNISVSTGFEQKVGNRNSPSLANIAYHPYFTREGGVPTLEMQVLIPIQEEAEFAHNILDITETLKQDSSYREMSLEAYNQEISPFVITRSLSVFERTLISGNSKYDRYLNQQEILSESEFRGLNLFQNDRTACSKCHGDFNFTNYSFENNGLYAVYPDIGRMRLTNDSVDLAKFKVPSLRNIELTAPYMHDGSIETLSEVIEHYNTGGQPHNSKSKLIKPLNLTDQEKEDLENFLKSLTDQDFVDNILFHE